MFCRCFDSILESDGLSGMEAVFDSLVFFCGRFDWFDSFAQYHNLGSQHRQTKVCQYDADYSAVSRFFRVAHSVGKVLGQLSIVLVYIYTRTVLKTQYKTQFLKILPIFNCTTPKSNCPQLY